MAITPLISRQPLRHTKCNWLTVVEITVNLLYLLLEILDMRKLGLVNQLPCDIYHLTRFDWFTLRLVALQASFVFSKKYSTTFGIVDVGVWRFHFLCDTRFLLQYCTIVNEVRM